MLVGAAAGAALALLYTPRSGRKALEALRARGLDVDNLHLSSLESQRGRIEQAAAEARRSAARTRQDLLSRYHSAKGSPSDAG